MESCASYPISPGLTTARALPGRLHALSCFHRKYNSLWQFVWARGVLQGPKRRFPARRGGRAAGARAHEPEDAREVAVVDVLGVDPDQADPPGLHLRAPTPGPEPTPVGLEMTPPIGTCCSNVVDGDSGPGQGSGVGGGHQVERHRDVFDHLDLCAARPVDQAARRHVLPTGGAKHGPAFGSLE
jgi:hypothetical protein